MFFWVMRMIMAGYEWRGEKPFKNVYYTGIVRDKLRRKMSKSLGNSPDPLDLIEQFGADGVRLGMLLCSPAGNDILFDEKLCEQGRNFSNKLWNALRLLKGWEIYEGENAENKASIEWLESKINKTILELNDSYSNFRLSEALMTLYKLIWDDFCSWYLEMVKPVYNESGPASIDQTTYNATLGYFEQLLKVLHPWMPFITEELWHHLNDRQESDCIIVAQWPEVTTVDNALLSDFDFAAEVVTQIRNLRSSKGMSPNEPIELLLKSKETRSLSFDAMIIKLSNLSKLETAADKVENSFSFMVGKTECFIPVSGGVDLAAEKDRLTKELEYNQGFLKSVQAKLGNERFVANAKPEVVEMERKKMADAEAKIKAIAEQLAALQG